MKTTPFTHFHEALGARMAPFAGYNMPIEYPTGIKEEHLNVRNKLGVFDVSHMGEFWIKGPKAFELVQKLTTNDVAALIDGKVQYSCFPNDKGGIVDDLLVYRFSAEKYLLVVNAANIEKDWNWVVKYGAELGMKPGVELENASDNICQLAIQGPLALKAMQKLTSENVVDMEYYTFKEIPFAGIDKVIFSTTGYTGSGGCEVYAYNKDAEKFNMTSLQNKSDTLDEEISVYGIEDDSRYVKISDLSALKGNEAYISASYADKYSLSVGETVVLDEKYENKQYEFEVAGIYDHSQALAVFLSNEQYCEIFDMDSDAFTGYLSDSEITDIDEDEIATVITEHDITKMCDQLDHSMGSYMTYFQYLCILLSAVLIYLLTKLIIEKNENAISMTKILGYENREIASLYLLSTTIVLVVIDVASVILGVVIMKAVWRIMLFSYSGWYAFRISTMGYVKMFLFILIGYLLVMVLDFRRIKRIPMDQALKNVE